MVDSGLGLFALRHGGNFVQVLLGQPRPGLDSSPAFWGLRTPQGKTIAWQRQGFVGSVPFCDYLLLSRHTTEGESEVAGGITQPR